MVLHQSLSFGGGALPFSLCTPPPRATFQNKDVGELEGEKRTVGEFHPLSLYFSVLKLSNEPWLRFENSCDEGEPGGS
jgi:hypothetical protein